MEYAIHKAYEAQFYHFLFENMGEAPTKKQPKNSSKTEENIGNKLNETKEEVNKSNEEEKTNTKDIMSKVLYYKINEEVKIEIELDDYKKENQSNC